MIALALTALIACQDGSRLVDPAADRVSASAAQAQLRLTYMCGNRFRIRTTRTDTVLVRWDVYQKNDTGSVVVPGIESPATQRDVFFETSAKGTARIFLGSQLVDTKANGNTACSATISESLGYPNDSAFTVVDSSASIPITFFRRIATVKFQPSLSDADISAFLTQHQALILSGLASNRVYIIQLPDLGPSLSAMRQRLDSLLRDPRIVTIYPASPAGAFINRSGWRFPDDAARERTSGIEYIGTGGVSRDAWSGVVNDTNWAMRAIGANAAWGCENGLYGASADLPAIAIFESFAPSQGADLQASVALGGTVSATDSIPGGDLATPGEITQRNIHAREVAALITAEGNNGAGVAGVMWRTKLFTAMAYTPTNRPMLAAAFHDKIVPQLASNGVRVINISTHLEDPDEVFRPEAQLRQWRATLTNYPDILFVLAAGQGQGSLEFQTLPEMSAVNSKGKNSTSDVGNLLYHFSRLKKEGFRNLLIVGGARPTFAGGRVLPVRWENGHWVRTSTGGGMDIVAPAQNVLTISGIPFGQTIEYATGTSFAAPLVSGAAAAALAIDPALTAVQLRDLIVESSRDSVVDDVTGATQAKAALYDGVYMLNVFNLLRRVSARSPMLPLCGQRVVVDGQTSTSTLRIERGTGSVQVALAPAQARGFENGSFGLSVAPGGRRIAVDVNDFASGRGVVELVLRGGQWQANPPRFDATSLTYADGDTVMLRAPNGGLGENFFFRRALGGEQWRLLFGELANQPGNNLEVLSVRVDPAARFLYAHVRGSSLGNCADVDSLIALRPGVTGTQLRPASNGACSTAGLVRYGATQIVWSPTASRAYLLDAMFADPSEALSTMVSEWQVLSNQTTKLREAGTLPGWLPGWAYPSADGASMSIFEIAGPGVCRWRQAPWVDPTQTLSTLSSACVNELIQLKTRSIRSPLGM